MIKKLFSGLKEKIAFELRRNRRAYMFVIILFFTGWVTGMIYADKSQIDLNSESYKNFEMFAVLYPLQGVSRHKLFCDTFLNHLKTLSIIWISGWHSILLPIGFFQVILKGVRLGFTVSCLWQWYKIKGILFSFIALPVQNIIYMLAIVFFMVYQMKFSADRKYIRCAKGNKNFKRDVYINNICSTFMAVIVLLISALIESYVISGLIHSLCLILK